MAENEGKTRGSALAVIQSAQMAVGSAITGGAGAVAANDNGSVPLLEDLRDIGKQNESNTEALLNTMKSIFAFDKERFARDRDQARELAKEEDIAGSNSSTPSPFEMPEVGGLTKAIAAAGALIYFFKELGMNTDILKLPQQLKSVRAMTNFVKGIGTIATAGFGPAILRDLKLVFSQFGTNIKNMFNANIGQPIIDKFDEFKKFLSNSKLGQIFKSFDAKILTPIKNFFSFSGAGAGPFATISGYFDDAKTALSKAIRPITNFFKGLTTGTTGLFAAAGPLAGIMAPIRAVASGVSKLFLPLAAILGIFDGVSGFTKEYEDTGSIVDGIRGAVVAIVDGFIGSFVRLITDLVGMALEFLGLENLGKMVADFGADITKSFSDTIGGLVDIVTGIFTLDIERILGGIGATLGGLGNFLFDIVSLPINTAVNFVKDIFGFGDPDKPFSLKDFFLGEDGPVMGAWNWFKSLFSFDFSSITQRLFDMGKLLKGLAAGGIAAAKAILPGGESPGEAFNRVFQEYTKGNEVQPDTTDSQTDIARTVVEDVKGDVTETTYKTNTIKEGGTQNNQNVTYVDNSNKQNSNTVNSKSETYTGKLDTGIDSFHDRAAYAYI